MENRLALEILVAVEVQDCQDLSILTEENHLLIEKYRQMALTPALNQSVEYLVAEHGYHCLLVQ
ncbi:MAG: hypothetical protein Q8M57_05250 [Nitrosomonas sp.]|uniref:hypothetical protein n=1 Tax=Nitrosomonas sp. TaxID=42353 RepID=UPI00273564E2|nr:hypothetical protein [Nitrosomonas sp.]MDP3280443.1 hypothetical protein [Nitrosomonas sp.]